jgi:hypothetical protein
MRFRPGTAWQVSSLRDESWLYTLFLPAALWSPITATIGILTHTIVVIPLQFLLLFAPSMVYRLARYSLLRSFAASRRLELVDELLANSGSARRLYGNSQIQTVMKLLRIGVDHPAFEPIARHLGEHDAHSLLQILDNHENLTASQVKFITEKLYQALCSGSPMNLNTATTGAERRLRLRTRPDLDDETRFLLLRFAPTHDIETILSASLDRGGIRTGEGARLATALVTHPLVSPDAELFISQDAAGKFVRRTLSSGVYAKFFPSNPDAPVKGVITAGVARQELGFFIDAVIKAAPVNVWFSHLLFSQTDPVVSAYAAERPLLRHITAIIESFITAPCPVCAALPADERPLTSLWQATAAFAPDWDLDLAALARLVHRLVCHENIDPVMLAS